MNTSKLPRLTFNPNLNTADRIDRIS
jgi:hypothetical protein